MHGTDSAAKTQVETMALAFWSPSAAIDRVASLRSPWLIQAVILTLQLVVATLAWRFVLEVRIGLLSDSSDRSVLEAAERTFRVAGYLMLIMTPVKLFLWWYIGAGFLHILDVLFNAREQPFSRMFSLAVFASAYSSLSDLHVLLVWYVRGVSAFTSPEALNVPIGLNLIPVIWSSYWYALMGHFNLYEGATTTATAFGFVRLTGSSWIPSYLCIFGAWLALSAIKSMF